MLAADGLLNSLVVRRGLAFAMVAALAGTGCSWGGSEADESSEPPGAVEVVVPEGRPVYRWAPGGNEGRQFVVADRVLVAVAEHLPTGVVRSTDRGRTWRGSRLPGTLGTRRDVSLAARGKTVVVMSNRGASSFLWTSADGGATFTDVPLGGDPVFAPTGRIVEAGGSLLLLGWDGPPILEFGGPVLWRSNDHGASWATEHPAGVPAGAALGELVELPDGRLLALRWSTTPELRALVSSSDAGRSWRAVEPPIELPAYGPPRLRVEDGVVFFGSASGDAVSHDSARTWTALSPLEVDPNAGGSSVAFMGDVAVAIGSTGGGDLGGGRPVAARSTDDGATWQDADVSSLRCTGAGADAGMSRLVRVGGDLYSSWRCNRRGPEEQVVRSEDRGRSWQLADPGDLGGWTPLEFIRTDGDHAVALLAHGRDRAVAWLGCR